MIDIQKILHDLSIKRPIFHSEADFQHALAWQIREFYRQNDDNFEVQLERRLELKNGEDVYLNILLKHDKITIPIELKYKTKGKYKEKELIVKTEEDTYKLRNHAAQDVNRYLFLKDISRVERIIELYENSFGYAIFLSNEPGYWKKSSRDTIDEDFRLHEERILEGNLKWKDRAASGTIKGNELPIKLRGKYKVHWKHYYSFQEQQMDFKYLLVEVKKELDKNE